jgi:membrane fusion protein (multidrug efflux system)
MNKSNLLILFGLSLILGACGNSGEDITHAQQLSLPVLSVTTGSAVTEQDYPASIEGTQNVEIRPQVSGFLSGIYVDEGQRVQAGQLLFKISDQPYSQQLNNALGKLHAAQAATVNAQLEIDRIAPLVDNKVISDFQLKVAKATLNIAKANVEQASADVATARINLGYTQIKAPVNGFIGRLPKKTGSILSPADAAPMTTLSDVHNLRVYFSLSEDDFVKFKAQYQGSSIADKLGSMPPIALVLSDNSLYPLKGRIDMVDGQFNSATGAITLRANFPNPDGLLRSGNTGKVRLSLSHRNVVLVPQSATLDIQDKVFVFKVDRRNQVSKRAIIIAGTAGKNYLITSGIRAGDRIVTEGFEQVKEGASIKPDKKLTAGI